MAAEVLMRSGPLANVALGSSTVGPTGSGVGGVLDELKRVMDLPDLQVAVTLAQPKSNRKPVLQLLDGRGRCHGWAKVSWNDRTEQLVGNEAKWLTRQAAPPLRVPELLHDGVLAGRRVVITNGFVPSRRMHRNPAAMPDLSILKAVAKLGNSGVRVIQGTAWYRSVLQVLPHATDQEREAIEAVFAACEDIEFEVGAWHGDFTPWNLMSGPEGVNLIDWEFAADEAPIGFDLCHFNTQVNVEMRGMTTEEALGRSALAAPVGLERLGVPGPNRWPVWRLYLVELARRLFALRAAGYPTENVHQGPAALAQLIGDEPSLNLVS